MRVRILSVLETFKMKYFKYCYSSPTRFEVFKFSLSGMDKADQMEARIAQAIKLGAKPPKKLCLPYDQLKTKLKSEREEAQRRKVRDPLNFVV